MASERAARKFTRTRHFKALAALLRAAATPSLWPPGRRPKGPRRRLQRLQTRRAGPRPRRCPTQDEVRGAGPSDAPPGRLRGFFGPRLSGAAFQDAGGSSSQGARQRDRAIRERRGRDVRVGSLPRLWGSHDDRGFVPDAERAGPISFERRGGPKTAKTKGNVSPTKRAVSRRGSQVVEIIGARNQRFRRIVCFQRLDRLLVSRSFAKRGRMSQPRPSRARRSSHESSPWLVSSRTFARSGSDGIQLRIRPSRLDAFPP